MAEDGEGGRGVFLWENHRKNMPANVYIFFNIACPLGRLFVCACMCVHFKYPAGSSRQKKVGNILYALLFLIHPL